MFDSYIKYIYRFIKITHIQKLYMCTYIDGNQYTDFTKVIKLRNDTNSKVQGHIESTVKYLIILHI